MNPSRFLLASKPALGPALGMALGVLGLIVGPSVVLETPVAWAGEGKASSSSSRGGALGRTTRAVGAKTNSAPSSSGSSSNSGSGSSSSYDSSYDTDPTYYPGYYGGCYGCTPAGPSTSSGSHLPARVSVDMGVQSVRDSDGAASAGLRVSSGRFGLGIDAIRYFEDTPASDGSDSVYMNLWAITGQGRLLDVGGTSLWLQAGVGGTTSNEFEPLSGAVFGAELAHVVNQNLDLYASARYFILTEEMRASELRAGVGVSFLKLGYRTFAFEDAGEPLHGPEFGLNFGF